MTTTFSPLDHIVALNNQGCNDLEQGNLDAAMSYFKTALSSLKGNLRVQPHYERCPQSNRPHLLQMPLHLLRSKTNAAPSPSHHAANAGTKESSQQSQFVVYSSAMRMVPGFRFSEDIIENTKIYTSLVVFNLALTLHLQGLKNCCRRSLQKAQSLYTHTYQLVDAVINAYYQQGRPTENASFDLCVLALLNNIALIHLEFAEFGRAEAAFQSLIRYARISSSFQKRSSTSPYRRNHDQQAQQQEGSYDDTVLLKCVDSMLLNATVMGLNTMSTAAAA